MFIARLCNYCSFPSPTMIRPTDRASAPVSFPPPFFFALSPRCVIFLSLGFGRGSSTAARTRITAPEKVSGRQIGNFGRYRSPVLLAGAGRASLSLYWTGPESLRHEDGPVPRGRQGVRPAAQLRGCRAVAARPGAREAARVPSPRPRSAYPIPLVDGAGVAASLAPIKGRAV